MVWELMYELMYM